MRIRAQLLSGTWLLAAVAVALLPGQWMLAVPAATAARIAPSGPAAGGRHQVAAGGTWGKVQAVPGMPVLNRGNGAGIGPVSCASQGNCSAGGLYTDRLHHEQAFVVSQVRGTWRRAAEVPGTAALNKGGHAAVTSLSCASAGNCSAVGWYSRTRAGGREGFVVSQVRGTWRFAIGIPGLAALNSHGNAQVTSISCASPGNCAAVGFYTGRSFHQQAFAVSQVHGRWHRAIEVPGTAALNAGGAAQVSSVSCAAPGNCAAGGSYRDAARNFEAFVVTEVNGTWHTAIRVPGTASLNQGGGAAVAAVSCASAGNCVAGGAYSDADQDRIPFVISLAGGTWGTATKVPGMAALDHVGAGAVLAVSCPAAGECTAGGVSGVDNGFDPGGGGQAFAVMQTRGTWGTARLIPGTSALNSGADAAVTSISCPSPGNCAAAGYYGVGQPGEKVHDTEAFVASQSRRTWHRAIQVPGTAALDKGNGAQIGQVSCAAPGRCSAGGNYADRSFHGHAFVVSE